MNDKSGDMKGMNMKNGNKNEAANTSAIKGKTEESKKKADEMNGMKIKDNSMAGMDMGNTSTDIVTLNYAMLKAPEKTTLRPGPLITLSFELTGNMNRYVWSIDNKVVSEADNSH